MTTYTITEHVTGGQRTRTAYTFTREDGTFRIFESFEASATGNGRRLVTVSLNMQPPGVRSSQRELAEAKADAMPVGFARIIDGQLEESTVTAAVEAGLLTLGDTLDLSTPATEEPAEHEAPTLAAVPMAEPETEAEPAAAPAAEPAHEPTVTIERDCPTTITVETTKGAITADVPYIGNGRYAVDYSTQQIATITPGLHYSTVNMNASREQFRAQTPEGAAWNALAKHLTARGYCVPDLS